MSREAELLEFVERTFPGWGVETAARLEAMGTYLAGAWTAGAEALRSRAIDVSDALHEKLGNTASHVASTGQGGTTFVAYLRQGIDDDPQFMKVVLALATVYARSQSGHKTSMAIQAAEVAGFEVYDLVGKGNMGRVFKAKQKSLDRIVALKVLDSSLAENDPTFVQRFTIEAKAVAQLQHPNIVGVIDQGICPRTSVQYIAFEFIDGKTAEDLMRESGGKLPEKEALAICLAMASALVCAEEHGIVHRDIKPSNILIGKDGIPKLADLGLAKQRLDQKGERDKAPPELTQAGLVIGTPLYMAPEQAIGVDQVDTRADLYSLGVCLWYFLTGEHPLREKSPLATLSRHVNEDVPDPRTVNPQISADTAALILSLTKRNRDERYPSAHAAAVDIELVMSGRPPLGPIEAGSIPRLEHSGEIRAGTTSGRFSAADIIAAGAQPAPVEFTSPPELEAGAAALWRFARGAHPEDLEAAQIVFADQSGSEDPRIEAQGLAGLGRIHLLRGEAAEAEKSAKAALSADPGCVAAVEVLADHERGVAARAKFAAAVVGLSAQVTARRLEVAKGLSSKVRREFPSEPHPHLVNAVAARDLRDDAGLQESIQLAWALFPSKIYLQQTLGPGFDVRCMQVLADYGWEALESKKPGRVVLTVENINDKSNLVAGALRMAIGVGHAALVGEQQESESSRRILFQLARALGALQHFAAAQDLLRQISKSELTEEETEAIEQVMTKIASHQGVKQSGIKPKRGRYSCPVGNALQLEIRQRVKTIELRFKETSKEVESFCERLSEIALDERIQQEVRQAAQALDAPDPYGPLEGVEAEQRGVEEELKTLAEVTAEPKEKKTGFLAKLKGAAGAAGRTAKHGQLKIKEAQLRSRRGAVVKALGRRIIHELGSYDYQHPEVGALTRRARRRLTTEQVLKVEEQHLQRVLAWLSA